MALAYDAVIILYVLSCIAVQRVVYPVQIQ